MVDPASIRGLRHAAARTPGRPTFGPAVGKIAAAMGTPLMPWQRHVLDVALEVLPDGEWAYTDVVITVQRQQGKTTLDGPLATHRCLTKPFTSSWMSAQTRQDARDYLIDSYVPRFEHSVFRTLGRVRRSQGSEGIWFPRMSTQFRVFAPVEEALHGKQPAPALVMNDEHWAFDLRVARALGQAIGPTFLTTGGQWFRHSTAGTDESVWLNEDVKAGRAAVARGDSEGMAYFEIGLPEGMRDDVEELLNHEADSPEFRAGVELLLQYMPARGYTLKERVVFNEAKKMRERGAVGEILRGYGNIGTRTLENVLPARPWGDARVERLPKPGGPVAIAFACARDRSHAAVVAAWREPGDERIRWRVLDERPGTSWVADRVAQLVDDRRPLAVGYDRFGPATDIGDELEQRGYHLERITYAEMATACIGVLAAVLDSRLVYAASPALDDVHERAAKKELGNRWVWDLKASGGSIAGLDAGTMAGWFFDHAAPVQTLRIVDIDED
jgi:hypothetical protein